jgi:protein FAM32A
MQITSYISKNEMQQHFLLKQLLTSDSLSFLKQQKRIMDRASQTHKQRVESFNQHLDNLTEHFDIPKVSWTK